MSQLPRVANAILDNRKITQYLLSTVHPTGASKAKFFISFGFSPAAGFPRIALHLSGSS